RAPNQRHRCSGALAPAPPPVERFVGSLHANGIRRLRFGGAFCCDWVSLFAHGSPKSPCDEIQNKLGNPRPTGAARIARDDVELASSKLRAIFEPSAFFRYFPMT